MKYISHLLLSLFVISLSACSPGIRFKPGEIPAPPAESQEAVEQGRYLYEQLVHNQKVYRNRAAERRVSNIASRILYSAPPMGHWEITLLDDDSFNAMTTPGNYIYVHRGLLETCSTDDEVAAVLSHEVAHRLSRHDILSTSEKWGNALTLIAGIAAGVAVGTQPGVSQSDVANTVQTTVKLGSGFTTLQYSRDKEREADQIGIFLMADAGYDPSGFAAVWARKARQEGSSADFFSTHPDSAERYETATALLPLARERYRQAQKRKIRRAPYQKSIPSSVHYEASQGFLAVQNRDITKAKTIARSLTSRAPYYSDGYNIMGLAHFLQGDIRSAEKSFKKGLRIDRNNASLLYNMACVDVQYGRHTSALDNLERAFKQAPSFVETAQTDPDLEPLRGKTRFHTLTSGAYAHSRAQVEANNSYAINSQ